MERGFQPVRVAEIGRDQTLEVLRARQRRLELHHLLAINDDALEAATDLSRGYLPDRKQPDRSIDLLDETCARVSLLVPEKLADEVIASKMKRDQLVAAEKEFAELFRIIAEAKGNPIERFSRGTFKAIEAMGLGVEKLITGETTHRPPMPVPDSVRRLQQSNPEAKLAKLHMERLLAEDKLREVLMEYSRKLQPKIYV